MVMRGIYDINYKSTIPMIWIPFSADENVFYPDNSIRRQNLIGFAGMTGPLVYATRRKALKRLKKAKLLKVCDKNMCNKGNKKKNIGYPLFLKSMVACLTSTEHYDWPQTPHAKTFEIMGSGALLLTPNFLGIEEMLGKDGVNYVKYNKNCSDVVEKAKWIINHSAKSKTIAKNGYKMFLKKHTDSIRIKEFYKHLARLVEGKPIERNYEWEKN